MNYFSSERIAEFSAYTFTHLWVEQQSNVLTITLNRPEKKNALNPLMIRELAYAFQYATQTTEVWMVVLKAEGTVFCAGMDLSAMQATEPLALPEPAEPIRLFELMTALEKPCIAMVKAPVYAGGILLLAGSTFVLAEEHVTFSLPEVKRGLFPFQVLDALIQIGCPERKVLDWCLRARTLNAHEALNLGLLTAIQTSETELIKELLALSPQALRFGLRAARILKTTPVSERQAYLFDQFKEIQQTADAQEGMQAFLEKRLPVWKNE